MHAHVVDVQPLTPSMVRITLTGRELADFAMPDATDAYINVAIPPAGAEYPATFDPTQVRDDYPKEQWPARRRYTVRSWDATTQVLTLDFVVHGEGAAGSWAAGAQPGDTLVFQGPGGGYRPDLDADWHLFAGDESALPAIAASLEVLPSDTRAVVRVVCDGPDHELPLPSVADLDVHWLHRAGVAADQDLLVDSLRELDFPNGRVHAFVHGEAEEIRAVRRHLLADRGLTRADMSCSPYWRRTMTDEAWRQVKGDFVAAMEADV